MSKTKRLENRDSHDGHARHTVTKDIRAAFCRRVGYKTTGVYHDRDSTDADAWAKVLKETFPSAELGARTDDKEEHRSC